MLRYFLLIPLLFSFFPLPLNGLILPKEIKLTHEILKDENKELSPLSGLVWIRGGILENLGEISTMSHPVISLIKYAFNRDNPVLYRETRLSTNVVSTLDVYKLGQIAGLLWQFKKEIDNNPALEKELAKITKPETLAKSKLIETLKANLIKVMNNGIDLENKAKISKSSNAFSLLLIRALLASGPDISVWKTISSLVNFKSINKEDFHKYYQGIASILGPSIFTDEGMFLTVNKEAWLANNFSDDDKLSNSYEDQLFDLIEPRDIAWLEPYLTIFQTAHPSDPQAEGFGFPDCGEDSLLNLYRVLFAKNDKEKSIDIMLLTELKSPKDVIDFFKTYHNLNLLRTPEARRAWAALLSNRPGLFGQDVYENRPQYEGKRRPQQFQCELKGGGFSIISKALLDVQGFDLDTLVEKLNAIWGKSFVKIQKNLDSSGLGSIRIITNDRGNFIWLFQAGHFVFDMEKAPKQQEKQLIAHLLESNQPQKDFISLLAHPFNYEIVNLLHRSNKNAEYNILMVKLNGDDNITSYIGNLLFDFTYLNKDALINRLQNQDSRTRTLVKIIAHNAKIKEMLINELNQFKGRDELVDILNYCNFDQGSLLTKLLNNSMEDAAIHLIENYKLTHEALTCSSSDSLRPIHIASNKGNAKFMAALLPKLKPEDINELDGYETSALEHAVQGKQQNRDNENFDAVVNILLPYLTQTTILNTGSYSDDNALQIAKREGFNKIAEAIEEQLKKLSE